MMRVRTARDIGIIIREARNRRGLSQAALAKQLNTTQTWVSWIENGKPTAEIGAVLLALTTLGARIDISMVTMPPSGNDHHRHEDDDDESPPYTL